MWPYKQAMVWVRDDSGAYGGDAQAGPSGYRRTRFGSRVDPGGTVWERVWPLSTLAGLVGTGVPAKATK